MTPTTAPEGARDVPATATLIAATRRGWGGRVGVIAFAFFFIKGLVWLIVPAAVAAFAAR